MKILTILPENYKKSIVKHFTEKTILFNFENLSTIFCRKFFSNNSGGKRDFQDHRKTIARRSNIKKVF